MLLIFVSFEVLIFAEGSFGAVCPWLNCCEKSRSRKTKANGEKIKGKSENNKEKVKTKGKNQNNEEKLER